MTTISLGPFPQASGFEAARGLDGDDSLASFRERFVNTEPDLIYLDGNSLGRQPNAVAPLLDGLVQGEWGEGLIRSWNESWWDLQLELGDRLAPIIGASPREVVISDSTSVNLYKLAEAAVRAQAPRKKIVTDDLNFPADVYVLDGIAKAHDMRLMVVESDGISGPVLALSQAIDEDTALVSLSHTVFKSGYTYDIGMMNRVARQAGALTLWDTSHSVGAMPIDLEASGSDLAVGCTYKYLNGGPGSPAFLYVRESLQAELENPITSWWGHARPFDFDLGFEPSSGIRRFHTGTMPILSLAAIAPGIDMVSEAGIEHIRAKSVELTTYLIELWESQLEPLGFQLASPRDAVRRGSHVSLSHPEGWPITRALIDVGRVIPDFRSPDTIRLGLSPLYTSFIDVHTAVHRLRQIVEQDVHLSIDPTRRTVT